MSEIVVVDYDPSWPGVFERLRVEIWKCVADVAIAIEHVGSTAVPGLAAKPVIDVDVVVRADDVGTAIGRLTSLGYEHQGDLGVAQREAFGRPAGSPNHHLYLCPEGSPALANHLAVRDHLRANPAVARAYGDLKKTLAGQYAGDSDGYVQAKTHFLLGVLRDAGFPEAALADIERMNRGPTTRDVGFPGAALADIERMNPVP